MSAMFILNPYANQLGLGTDQSPYMNSKPPSGRLPGLLLQPPGSGDHIGQNRVQLFGCRPDPALIETGSMLRSYRRARGQWTPGRGMWRCW